MLVFVLSVFENQLKFVQVLYIVSAPFFLFVTHLKNIRDVFISRDATSFMNENKTGATE